MVHSQSYGLPESHIEYIANQVVESLLSILYTIYPINHLNSQLRQLGENGGEAMEHLRQNHRDRLRSDSGGEVMRIDRVNGYSLSG